MKKLTFNQWWDRYCRRANIAPGDVREVLKRHTRRVLRSLHVKPGKGTAQ